jgi:peptide/nickel transport system permease protein
MAIVTAVARPVVSRPSVGPGRRAMRRFFQHRGAVVGLGILTLLVIGSVFGPLVYPVDPSVTNVAGRFQSPGPGHPLGTDSLGRDQLARLLDAGRVSLSVGLSAALFATGIGLVLGLFAGVSGGIVDTGIMRVADVVLSLPLLIAVAVVIGVIGTGVEVVVITIGLLAWPEPARVVRAVVLSLVQQDFVAAARALGASRRWIIRRHLVWHALAPMTVTGTFIVAGALLTEAALSYLGIGVKPPQASWGNMLSDAQQLFILRQYAWFWLPPGLMIFSTVLAVNLVGDGLRDALDPKD